MQHSSAIIAPDATIHETAIIEPFAVIGSGVVIGPRVYIGAHAVIGAPAQHHDSYPSPITARREESGVIIGEGSCIREFATIHHGIVQQTIIGCDVLLMAGVHIAHDCEVGNQTTIGSFSALGGFTLIDSRVTLGQGVITHPWIIIGEGAMIGLNSSIIRDVEPFAKVAGSPARLLGTNTKRAPGAAAEYSPTAFGLDVWERFAVLGDARDDARRAYAERA